MKNLLILVLVTFLLWTGTFTLSAKALDTTNGAQIFGVHCAGCHINGGNIIRRGKNLKKNALKKYGMDSLEAISAIVTNGKSNMSAYKDRLSSQEIADVAAYVLEQAETGWR
ncbi:cytochrome c, mono- and diheme variants family [Cylindrospermum stagnale PCC 7417]|uniref:Cytochrome c, mono-and diheme variants family n=1 Tax=Cylindrospermum stagnale PCC 7417 TaxID=56107 RepID=K9WW43_9NOST|nr:c-type cytochrome [Cylindrospermum stagnale]AFZ24575.1 cytochrome c, mono- and diheme variants family [Cylindrospermum stagnale PCC 7417]